MLRFSPAVDAALFGTAVVVYIGLLFLLRLVTLSEISVMWRAVAGARRPAFGTSGGDVS
jgi:hypothetical protein